MFDDADLDQAVAGAIASKYRNTGQTCVCANRFLIQEGIYSLFAQKLALAVAQLQVGPGWEENVQQGPLINQRALQKVEQHIQDAKEKGAHVLLGGRRHSLGGTFFEPTVLTDVSPGMILAQKETFGPVAPLFRFETEQEAILLANNTEFGLAAYVYTKDVARITRVAEALEYGMVGIEEFKPIQGVYPHLPFERVRTPVHQPSNK